MCPAPPLIGGESPVWDAVVTSLSRVWAFYFGARRVLLPSIVSLKQDEGGVQALG
jgi:hypothetical protein